MPDDKKYTCIRYGHSRAIARVEFIDEGWNGCPLFLLGHEFGPTHLIRASSFDDAWEAWVDSQNTVAEDDLWEAYGFDSEDSYKAFNLLFGQDLKEQAWVIAKADGIEGCGVTVPNDYPLLAEGYEYQSNASGTGIVEVGHYAWVADFGTKKIHH
jgi:hypothetical protein